MSRVPERRRRPARRTALLYLVTVVALATMLYSVYGQRQRNQLRVGESSPGTFVAPVDLQVTDRVATERDRQAARSQIETVYTSDPGLQRLVVNELTGSGLPADVVDLLLVAYQDPEGVSPQELAELVEQAVELAPENRKREVRLVLERRLIATSSANEQLTEAARAAAAAAVRPVMEFLQAGQIIVREGEEITEDQLRVLEAVGLYNPRTALFAQTFWIVLGCLLLALLLASPLAYLQATPGATITFGQLGALVVLTLAVLLVQRLLLLASPHFLIVLLVPLLIAVLISVTAASLWGIWLTVATTLLAPGLPMTTLVTGLAGALVAVALARSVNSRVSLLLAGTAGGAAAGLALVTLGLAMGGYTPLAVLTGVVLLLGGGVLAGITSLGLLPLAESAIGFLTDFRLLELSSPTSPLLQKLLLEAPGTYQHSLVISNLVEQAVRNIGGNALLARVGALYHDVGKLKRPHFYVENQVTGDNPHDRVSPHLSYLIITAHVRDGLDLLREHRLPRELEPFVTEHHGTTVLSYFYKRALDHDTTLNDLNFRYPGPKPRSKETAVLMLADAVESASRTLTDPSQGSIRALIDRLVEARLADDQLSLSPLNFRDLEVIGTTFERMLTAILHRRISYPSPEEVQGARRGGDSRRNEPVPAS